MFVEPEHLEIIKNILHKHVPEYDVWAFGSRVHGEHLKKFSDLDLAIIADKQIPWKIIADLQEEFSESYLPFKVDVLEFMLLNSEFKKIIKDKYEVVQKA